MSGADWLLVALIAPRVATRGVGRESALPASNCWVAFEWVAAAASAPRGPRHPIRFPSRPRCAGRIAWTFLAAVVSSGWPMLFFDISISLVGSLLLFW